VKDDACVRPRIARECIQEGLPSLLHRLLAGNPAELHCPSYEAPGVLPIRAHGIGLIAALLQVIAEWRPDIHQRIDRQLPFLAGNKANPGPHGPLDQVQPLLHCHDTGRNHLAVASTTMRSFSGISVYQLIFPVISILPFSGRLNVSLVLIPC